MTAPALFSTVFAPEDAATLPDPTNGPYFVATQDGYMVMQGTHWGRTLTPIGKIEQLPDYTSMFWHEFEHKKLPARLVGQAWSFFRAIYESRKSEAAVDITWHRDHGYRLFVPPQQASHGGVKFTRNPEHYIGQIVGTIHSHCNFGAFHSGTDRHDADGTDGLHLTIGKVLSDPPEIAVMFSRSKVLWDDTFKVEDVIDGELRLVEHPKWWERFVSDPEPVNAGKHVSTWTNQNGNWKPKASTPPKPQGSVIQLPGSTPDKLYPDLASAVIAGGIGNDGTLVYLTDLEKDLEEITYQFGRAGIELVIGYRPDPIPNVIWSDDDDLPMSLLRGSI